uniref:C2H2-type domain-containing protein n=1 Tax=Pygocentrus nattereri TaxID=42514 RepID=A0AAR2J9H6_PYGNA
MGSKSEVVADSKFSGGAFSLHCVEETLPSAAYADEMNPVHVNPATSVYKRFAALPYADKPEVVSQKAGLERDLTTSANHTEEVPSSADIKVKLEEDFEPAPETQQDAPVVSDKDAAKAAGEHGPSRVEPSSRPLFRFAFVRSSDLRKHERNMHANDKPFPCKKCGKTFNKPLSLMRHERTHLGERPFLCPECGKAFAVASRMAEHRKIHTGLRPYTCHICSKSFTKSSNLAEHLSIHTGLPELKGGKCESLNTL